mgnify:FL=1
MHNLMEEMFNEKRTVRGGLRLYSEVSIAI